MKAIISKVGEGAYKIIPVIIPTADYLDTTNPYCTVYLPDTPLKSGTIIVRRKDLYESETAAREYIEKELMK